MWLLLQLSNTSLPGFDIMAERLLVFAARSGDEQLLGRMLEKSINVNVPAWVYGGISMTALHEAVRCQNANIMQQLLKKGARVDGNLREGRGWVKPVTPLGFLLHPVQNARCSRYGLGSINMGIVDILLQAGAEVDEADNLTGLTVLQKSIDLGIDELTNLVLDHQPLSSKSYAISDKIARETLLQTASRKDNITLMERLVDSQALRLERSFRTQCLSYDTVLTRLISPEQYAVRNKNKDMLRLLLKHGLQLEPVCPDDRSVENINMHRAHNSNNSGGSFSTRAFSPLQEATKEADMDFLIYLLDIGADINNPQFPPLPIAAENGDLRICRFLCMRGADVNLVLTGPSNATALQAAATSGNADLLRLLISLGADVNEPPLGFQDCTALLLAVESQSLPATELLLEKGAEVNAASDLHALSALQWAVQIQYKDLVVLLLDAGADVEYRNLNGQSALLMALTGKSVEIVGILSAAGATLFPLDLKCNGLDSMESLKTLENILKAEEKSNRKFEGKSLKSVLIDMLNRYAGCNISMEVFHVAAFLLSNKSRYLDSTGIRNILHCTIAERNFRMVNVLLNAGTDFKGASKALVLAGDCGSVGLVRACIMAGMDIDTQDRDGWTALSFTSNHGHLNAVQLLLELGAKVDGPATSLTALQAAAPVGYFHIVVLLLSAGADINSAVGSTSETALELAAMYGRLDIACLLIQSNHDLGKLKADCRRAAVFAQDLNHPVLAKILRDKYTRLDERGVDEDNSVIRGRNLNWFIELYGEGNWV